VLAIRDAALTLGGWRLVGCTIYVTLEPCTMCAGAILQARPERVVWGAPEPATGASGSAIDVFRDARLPTRIPVDDGVLASESAALLRAFFAERRGG
jgi:tRNA(adenine34) deaminase